MVQLTLQKLIMKLLEQKTLSKDSTLLERKKSERVRLNHATTHHHPPPSTTTYQQPKYIPHHPPPAYSPSPTTTPHQPKYIHHHPPPAKKHPPLPTTSQKMDHHPTKAKIYPYIFSFGIAVTVSFSWKRNIPFRHGDFV